MRYVLIFLFLVGCGLKPHYNCIPSSEKIDGIEQKKTAKQEVLDKAKNCIKQPMMGVTKEF